MQQPFLGTFENKVDRKGRVSVPAAYRQILAGCSFPGIVAFYSYKVEAIEACSMDFMAQLADSVSDINLFSDDQEDLAATIFSDSHQLSFDGEGRVMLPDELIQRAGITERAAFSGAGQMFRIWEPARLSAYKEERRQRTSERGLTISLRKPEQS
ncbi:MAG: hypothetical protein WD489_10280 [Rhodovibrionaceae bacterium]